MEENKHIELILTIGTAILFIASAVAPIVHGYEIETTDSELMDNLSFYCYDEHEHPSSKAYYYGERFQNEFSDVELDKLSIPIESIPRKSDEPKDTPWPMKCHNLHHTSQSPYSTADNLGTEKWRFSTDGSVDGGPVIDNDGTIYFGGNYGGLPWYLFAVYPDGTLKWKYKTNGLIVATPAINEDGTIYIGTFDAKLYAINPNGSQKWKSGAGSSIASSPAIADDGTVYIGTMEPGNSIVAFYPNGTKKWSYETEHFITSDPAIGDDGTVYIGSADTYLYALYPNGTLRWRFKTGDWVKGHPSITDDGTIYFPSFDDYLYALYPNGTMKWKYKLQYGSSGSAAIGDDGTIYIGRNKLYAIYPNGTKKWTFDLGTDRWVAKSSPAISADGTIYFGTNIGDTNGGDIIAVNSDGTERWRKKIATDWVDSSPCIAEDGTVYIGSTYDSAWGYGYLHAFGPVESNTSPQTPTISGETNGKIGEEYEYKLSAVDPDNNPISCYIEWGDGTTTGWTREYASGEQWSASHTYNARGEYTIKAKARDTLGEESDWGTLEVSMPKNKMINPFERFLENHPRMFPILRQLIGL